MHKFSKNLEVVTNSKHQLGDIKQFPTEDPQILSATIQKFCHPGAQDLCTPDIVCAQPNCTY
jgi:hypothetical protein